MTTNAVATATTTKRVDRQSSASTFPLIRVLLVEDNPEHAEWIQDMVKEGLGDHCEIAWTGNLSSAIWEITRTPPDLVLLDLGLPDLSGFKCQLVLHLTAPALPVIIISGDDRDLTRQLTSLGSPRAFINKGEVTPELLAETIRTALTTDPDD